MPYPEPFHFSYSVDYIYDFCHLPDPDVGLSIFAFEDIPVYGICRPACHVSSLYLFVLVLFLEAV